jgi:molybdopterin-containing oxidoreductase family molybdopterin binding subunit
MPLFCDDFAPSMAKPGEEGGVMASVSGGEDVWIPSVCGMCPDQCGILVRRVDGIVTKIEGNPQSPLGRGRLCARGLAGMQLLYDPHRLDQPLKRGNPEKGIGVDPRWQPMSWDEALGTIVERLKRVRAEDPRRLVLCGTPVSPRPLAFAQRVFMPAFGSPNAFICDEHMPARTLYPDPDFCEYALVFGADCVSGAIAGRMADARVRGMRLVAVEPFLSPAAEKADEWLPIRPGSEGALACAMLNLLLNEYRLFDAEHVRRRTDGPYLVRPDGAYARDGASGKPLVWDGATGRPRPFDDEGAGPAIEGTYEVEGEECRPVFNLLREAVRQWTPEAAAEATTIPVETIRRVAREFGEAARIGSTVSIDGHELPLRPAAAVAGRDSASPAAWAITLLNEVVGASDVPGGLLGCSPVSFGYPPTGLPRWAPGTDSDGLLQAEPCHEPGSPPSGWPVASEPRPEVLIDCGSNLLMSVADPERCLEALKDCFVISFGLFSDETAEALADIVLPDACYLGRLDLPSHGSTPGLGDWACQFRQPAVPPQFERRSFSEVLLDIGQRLGLADAMNAGTNDLYGLRPPHALNPEQRYSWEEMADRICQNWFGPEHGLAWFRQNGVLTWPKRLEEAYCRSFDSLRTGSFDQGRVPLHPERLPRLGEGVQRSPQIGFDLQAVSYRVPWHTAPHACENPWLDEASQSEPYSYFICLNPRTAAARGIADGDAIWVESTAGRRVQGRARLTEGVHPEAVAIAGNGGHWARGMPVARGQGAFFNALRSFDREDAEQAFFTIDGDARVRAYKE